MTDTAQATTCIPEPPRAVARPLVLIMTLLLGACVSPAGLAPRGTPTDPATLAATRSLADTPAGDWPATTWWTAFGDPQLDRLVAAALQGSPTLDLARARIDRARAQAGVAAAVSDVHVGANVDGAQQRLSEHYIFPSGLGGTYTSINRAALDFSLDLDFWGRNRAALAAAVGEARATEADAAEARLVLASAVVRSYLQFDLLHRLRAIADATVTQREHLQKLVHTRQQAGLDARAEVQQAIGSVSAAKAERSALDTQLEQVRHQLAALTGQGPDAALDFTPPQVHAARVALPEVLPADLLGRRPDVVAQRWRVEAARQGSAAARAEFYPNVNLSAFVGVQSLGLHPLFESGSRIVGIGPAIHLPVFDSSRLRANLAVRHGEEDIAIAQYNATLVDALRDVADQLSVWRGAHAQARDQDAALARYEEAWRLATVRYRAGLTSYTAVLAAETPLLAQRRLSAELHNRQLDAGAGLARALGGGLALVTPPTPTTSTLR